MKTAKSLSKFKILLIDDDVPFATTVVDAAQKLGIKITTFTSLRDLGFIGSLQLFDLVAFDLHLPEVSGLEIAEYCEAFFKNKPVIVMSNTPPSNLRDLPRGVKRVLPKAIGIEGILKEMIAALPHVEEEEAEASL